MTGYPARPMTTHRVPEQPVPCPAGGGATTSRPWRPLWPGILIAMLGAGCSYGRPTLVRPPPIVFQQPPALSSLLEAVNQNSAKVQQLQEQAELSIEGMPTLQAVLALERPLRFRLQAESLIGPELDLGSNDQIYWLWVRRQQPPTVYYGRHEQFHLTQARHILPIPPSWLIGAVGVVFFDMQATHEGPVAVRPDVLEVRSQVATSAGPVQQVSVIDWRRAVVTEQHFYGQDSQRLASVHATDFDYDPSYQVALPQTVRVELPPANLAFAIRVHTYAVNQLWVASPQLLWQPPQFPGHTYQDLAGGTSADGLTTPAVAPQLPASAAPRALPPVQVPHGGIDPQAHRRRWPFWHIR